MHDYLTGNWGGARTSPEQGSSIIVLDDRGRLAGARLDPRFQFGNALFQRRNCARYFFGSVTRRDVFGAVPVEGNDVDNEEAFDYGLGLFLCELRNEFRMFARVFNLGVTEDFETIAFRIIHQEQSDAIIRGKIASREHLAIAFVVRKSKLRRTEHPQKPRLTAAMLNIRPAVFGDAGHIEAIAPGNEFDFLGREQVVWLGLARTIIGPGTRR